jgi:flavin-dependent dehydrogenase
MERVGIIGAGPAGIAAARFAAESAAFGCLDGNELSPREAWYLGQLAVARGDAVLANIAAR